MAQSKKVSVKQGDHKNAQGLQFEKNSETLYDRRKSTFPGAGGCGRRISSIYPGHMGAVVATRRFGRQLTKSDEINPIHYEPTYRLEPVSKFNVTKVVGVMKETLEEMLCKVEYNGEKCNSLSRSLVDVLKDRVKQVGYERYKIVVTVVLGQKKDQGVLVTSRCSWETPCDDFATCSYQNETIFCCAQVYGLYFN